MTSLVIVESPAKCKKIASYLGPGFVVLATMGHIRALEEDLDAVGINRDFEPRFRFLKEKSKATKPLLEAAAKATKIYLAADDDREGEAIAYSVACLLKCNPLTTPRAVFHEITSTAVKAAIENPRLLDMNRVFAQQARAVLDMMVGFTISPLLWKHVARALSAGRCQTPALRIVSDREACVKGYSTATTWALEGEFNAGFTFEGKMEDELEDQESALNYLENIHTSKDVLITSVEEKPWTANPPKPLITSSLQQEASALHKIGPKSTMVSAQALYEAGHITYMRTDNAVISEEAVKAAKDQVRLLYGEKYVGEGRGEGKGKGEGEGEGKKPESKKSKKTAPAQEAHEAIRPTHFELTELDDGWNDKDKKIYNLIYRRAIQSVMSAATGRTRTAKMNLIADNDSFPWSAKWRTTDFDGWQRLGNPAKLDDDDEEDKDSDQWKNSQKLTKGSKLIWESLRAAPKRSKAPPRFTEATLIRELEKKGIGRPSTFASLVEVLTDKEYVEKKDISGVKANHTTLTIQPNQWPPLTQITQVPLGSEKGKLVPTSLGESVLAFCVREFPQLFAYEFTAQMENRLDRVARGEEEWKQLCRDTWNSYKESYTRLNDKSSLPSSSEKVKDFGGGFKAVMSKTGPLLVQENESSSKPSFYTFPPESTIQSITEEEAKAWIQKVNGDTNVGTWENKPIVKKKGPYGEYLQCGEYRIPYQSSDTLDIIINKFKDRTVSSENTYKF